MPTVEEETLETPLIDLNLDDFIPGVGIIGSLIETGVKALAKKGIEAGAKGAWKHIFDIKQASTSFETDILSKPNLKRTVDWVEGKAVEGNYWKEYKGYDWKVVMMTPEEYIKGAVKLQAENTGGKQTEEAIRRMVEYTRRKEGWDYYTAMIKKGQKIPIPSLRINRDGYYYQEGYHRAMMAMELGLKEIPVYVMSEKASSFPVKDVIKLAKSASKK